MEREERGWSLSRTTRLVPGVPLKRHTGRSPFPSCSSTPTMTVHLGRIGPLPPCLE